jgi:hypothetical protein
MVSMKVSSAAGSATGTFEGSPPRAQKASQDGKRSWKLPS